MRSPVVKFNASMSRLPNWTAAPGEDWPAQATIDLTAGLEASQKAFETCAAGRPPSASARSTSRPATTRRPPRPTSTSCAVFGQYAPYDIADGDWDSRRKDVEKQFVDLISRFAPDFPDCLEESEVLGPPDIERRIGLTGGNIFQGEVTPDQMWEGRLPSRTPVPGLYMCGAATHPAGSGHRPERPQRRHGAPRGPRRAPPRSHSPSSVPGTGTEGESLVRSSLDPYVESSDERRRATGSPSSRDGSMAWSRGAS